ncbi:hypothetical protein NQD34_000069 [Periophthalmus magnuspinnatus]|nr:hypothetical protein NQD34_000069 [Periophthalmus magnuspinnatus]
MHKWEGPSPGRRLWTCVLGGGGGGFLWVCVVVFFLPLLRPIPSSRHFIIISCFCSLHCDAMLCNLTNERLLSAKALWVILTKAHDLFVFFVVFVLFFFFLKGGRAREGAGSNRGLCRCLCLYFDKH